MATRLVRRTIASSSSLSLILRSTVYDSSPMVISVVHGGSQPRRQSFSSSSSSSKSDEAEKKKPVLDRLSSVIDAVNDSKLPPELCALPPSSSTTELELNIADLNINRENMFLDDPEDSYITTVTGETPYASAIKLEDMNLAPEVIRGCLYLEMGFKRPSKIQAITLPMILTPPYKDLIAQAHNGIPVTRG